jgi:ATP-dependent DNA ligase
MPPVLPMLAKATHEVPEGDFVFEPKWDGFRCIVFRDGAEIELGSRNDRPLTRYFPELLEPLRRSLPDRCVVDGEIVVAVDGRLDFDVLGQRIHPAASRVNRLAAETPASYVAFDLLALGDLDLTSLPFRERREALLVLAADFVAPVLLTPSTTDLATARDWFDRFEGAGFDGVMAKPPDLPYVQDKRVQIKVKRRHTADCAVAGFRWHKDGQGIGSLLLGLYDDDGELHHVGVAASFTAKRRAELIAELQPYALERIEDHPWGDWLRQLDSDFQAGARLPGAPSRWNAKKEMSWVPLRVELVVEVEYEGLLNGRFRHNGRVLHFRPDRTAQSCTYAQLDVVAPAEIAQIFGQSHLQ